MIGVRPSLSRAAYTPPSVSSSMEQEPAMASWAIWMPSAKVAPWLMYRATSSVGLISAPLISEKCAERRPNAFFTSSAMFAIRPTVTMA